MITRNFPSYLSGVRVGFFGVDTSVSLDVVKSVVHKTAVAAHVSVFARAVDQVLFAEGDEFAGFQSVLTFERSSLEIEN